MPADFFCKQGDSSRSFIQALSYTDGSIPNLGVGTTVAFAMRSLASASTVSVTGTVAITNAAAGVVAYTPSAADTATPGNYEASWIVTFSNGSQDTFPAAGYLWVEIQPSVASERQQLVSLADVKEYLSTVGLQQHDRDHELLTMIEGMRPQIEAITGPIMPTVYDEWYDGGSTSITLRHRPSTGYGTDPLLTLIGVSEYNGPIEWPLALVPSPDLGQTYSAMLNPQTGRVTRRTAGGGISGFPVGTDQVHIVYQAGQKSVPANVRQAALEIVRSNFRTVQAAGAGRTAQADVDDMAAHRTFVIDETAMRMLNPTRKHPAFA